MALLTAEDLVPGAAAYPSVMDNPPLAWTSRLVANAPVSYTHLIISNIFYDIGLHGALSDS